MSAFIRIVADVAPEVKEKLDALKKPGETQKEILVKLIEQAHSKAFKK